MLSREEETEVDVRWEDQQRIIEFGTHNSKLHELRDEVAKLEKELETLADAEEEMQLVIDDDGLKIKLGCMYATESEEHIEEILTEMKKVAEDKLEAVKGNIEDITSRQKELKRKLYGRFGKSINLEE